jgi:hypothetical protein
LTDKDLKNEKASIKNVFSLTDDDYLKNISINNFQILLLTG